VRRWRGGRWTDIRGPQRRSLNADSWAGNNNNMARDSSNEMTYHSFHPVAQVNDKKRAGIGWGDWSAISVTGVRGWWCGCNRLTHRSYGAGIYYAVGPLRYRGTLAQADICTSTFTSIIGYYYSSMQASFRAYSCSSRTLDTIRHLKLLRE
jgi:hypothetical protein